MELKLNRKEINSDNTENTNLYTNIQEDENKNLFYLDIKNKRSNNKDILYFQQPRTDWDISQGDYIVKNKKEVKRKIFSKNDIKNLLSNLWYIVLSLVITYIVLNLLVKFL